MSAWSYAQNSKVDEIAHSLKAVNVNLTAIAKELQMASQANSARNTNRLKALETQNALLQQIVYQLGAIATK